MVLRAIRRFKSLKRKEICPPADPVKDAMEAELLWVKSAQCTYICNLLCSDMISFIVFSHLTIVQMSHFVNLFSYCVEK